MDGEVSGNGRVVSAPPRQAVVVHSEYALFDSAKFEHMQRIATAMSSARLVPKHLQGSVGDCLMIVELAFRLGVSPFMLAQKTYLVDQKIGYEAQVVAAMVNTNPMLETRLRVTYEGEGGELRCIVSGKLRGEDVPFVKKSPKVKDIKIKNSPLWTVDPEQQLGYWTQRAWARLHTPEIILGVYTPDDLESMIDVTPPEPERPAEDGSEGDEARSVAPSPGEPGASPTAGGPTAPKAASPTQPKAKAAEFNITDVDGECITYAKAASAASFFENQMAEAASRGEAALEGLWESNGQFLTELREAGRGSTADSMAKQYSTHLDELREAARKAAEQQHNINIAPQGHATQHDATSHEATSRNATTPPANGGVVLWTWQHPDYKKAPNKPKPFGDGNAIAFYPWFQDMLRDMPKAEIADFLSEQNFGKQYDHLEQHYPDVFAEVKATLAKRGI